MFSCTGYREKPGDWMGQISWYSRICLRRMNVSKLYFILLAKPTRPRITWSRWNGRSNIIPDTNIQRCLFYVFVGLREKRLEMWWSNLSLNLESKRSLYWFILPKLMNSKQTDCEWLLSFVLRKSGTLVKYRASKNFEVSKTVPWRKSTAWE